MIKDETLNILLAGRDTVRFYVATVEEDLQLVSQTASILTSAVYMLSEHPDFTERLRNEVLEHVGSRCPTFDDIKDMKYLRAFLNGTLVFGCISKFVLARVDIL